MLKNDNLIAKIGVDTAENELFQVVGKSDVSCIAAGDGDVEGDATGPGVGGAPLDGVALPAPHAHAGGAEVPQRQPAPHCAPQLAPPRGKELAP